jgi:hypothetical protein
MDNYGQLLNFYQTGEIKALKGAAISSDNSVSIKEFG